MAFDAYALWDDLEISLGFKSPPPDIDNKSLQYPEGGIAQLNLDFGVLDWSSYPKKFLSRACSPRDLKRHVQLPNLSVVSGRSPIYFAPGIILSLYPGFLILSFSTGANLTN